MPHLCEGWGGVALLVMSDSTRGISSPSHAVISISISTGGSIESLHSSTNRRVDSRLVSMAWRCSSKLGGGRFISMARFAWFTGLLLWPGCPFWIAAPRLMSGILRLTNELPKHPISRFLEENVRNGWGKAAENIPYPFPTSSFFLLWGLYIKTYRRHEEKPRKTFSMYSHHRSGFVFKKKSIPELFLGTLAFLNEEHPPYIFFCTEKPFPPVFPRKHNVFLCHPRQFLVFSCVLPKAKKRKTHSDRNAFRGNILDLPNY